MFPLSAHLGPAKSPAGCRFLLVLCALLALGLAGCGGDEPAPVAAPPAPPPAPPPFQPQPVEVALGDNGGTATLMTTEDGGFTLNGEAFAGGSDSPVEGEGGRMYVLTLADGTWSAAFQPMEIMVALGTSEESATLMTTEAGGYTLGGADFASGGTTMTEAGASYTLALGEDGMWSATFAPMTQTVTLGTAGGSVDLTSNEQGMWMIAETPLAGDGEDTYTTDGLTYALALGEDGMWSAAFVPKEVTVDLGTSEESVTLTTTEVGGYTLDGADFASGTTRAATNGNTYELSLGVDGAWTAAFVPMSVEVALGDGSASVTLLTTEAMGYTRDGADFASGDTVEGGPNAATGANNEYELTLGVDGIWTAAFVPATQVVTLGTSEESVTVSSTEAGAWAVDESAFQSGGTRAATNGNEYTLTLGEDGMWTAAFKPMGVAVRLGGSGETVTLWTTEAMGYALDGQVVVDGSTTTTNSVGETYVLSTADGTWSGTHRPTSATVELDPDNSVTLMTNEAGAWTLGGNVVSSGQTVEGGANAATGANNQYELTLGADGWTAAYQAATMTIEGTGGLQASAREDGTGYDVGDASLPASGSGQITVDSAMYRVAKDADGMLAGTRFDADIEGSVMKIDTLGTTGAPSLLADDSETAFNEKNTAVEFHNADFSVGDLLGSGVATAEGPNIVAKARADMVKIRNRVAALVALKRDGGLDQAALTGQLILQWNAADKVALAVFGQIDDANPALERTTSESRVLDAFDRLVDALSSVEAFQAATLANGPDKLQGFKNLGAAAAATAFNRVEWWATARLGTLGSTRFGAAVWNDRDNATANDPNPERAQAFAWSTMLQTRRSSDVRVSGAANYQGRTHAADQAGNLYAGAIDINVRFTRGTVDGRVDGLERADTGNPFVHGLGGAVTGIVLPSARLNARAEWSVTTDASSSSPGRLQYAALAGGQPDLNLSAESTFAGRLLGRGDQSGTEAIGTWTAKAGSTTLAGGFGATRGADTPPPGAAVTEDLGTIGKTGSVFAQLERGPARLEAPVVDEGPPRTVALPEIPASKVINTNNATFTYNPPVMDITYNPAVTDAVANAAEYVSGNYTPARETVLEEQDWEGVKGNWVEDARAEIVKKLAQLRRSIALDGADASDSDTQFANDQRQRLFTEIQDEIKKIFGPGRAVGGGGPEIYTGVLTRNTVDPSSGWTAHVDYPVTSAGVAQDAGVLAEIEDVIEALGSADAFADALADGGLFAATRTASAPLFENVEGGYPSAGAIFGRNRGKLLIAADDTDYTRLGAWRHQVSRHAADALSTQNYPARGGEAARGLELGSFAYSPLDPTAAYSDANNRLYPASGAAGTVSATYAGKTVAAQADLFYRGDVEAKVYWSPTTVTDSEITIEISNLEETVTGDALQVGNYVLDEEMDPRPGVKDVESLTWRLDITNSGEVRFGGDSTVKVGVSVNSLNEDPFRPAATELRLQSTVSGQNTYAFGTADVHYVLVADGEGAGTDADDDFGALSLSMVKPAGESAAAPSADQTAQFTRDQAALRYPTHVIGGPAIRDAAASEGGHDSFVFLFADGSMQQFGTAQSGQTTILGTPFRRAVGIEPALAANLIRAENISGMPLLSANNGEYLFTHNAYGKDFPALNTGGSLAGIGAPTGSPDALLAAFVTAGDYVNVHGTDANLASKVEGMFVGQDQDGPLGIIGTWELTGGVFGVESERGIIRGAFGADIQP